VVDQTTKLMDKMFDDYLKKQKQTFFRYKWISPWIFRMNIPAFIKNIPHSKE
jgi:hypothetical protein